MVATIIYSGNKSKGLFVELPMSEVETHTDTELWIYKSNGNWDVYELIDSDHVVYGDEMEFFATVGDYIRTEYRG